MHWLAAGSTNTLTAVMSVLHGLAAYHTARMTLTCC
jgi:hypothetical protein